MKYLNSPLGFSAADIRISSLSLSRRGAEAPLISNLFARRYQLEYLSLHFKSHPRASANGASEPGSRIVRGMTDGEMAKRKRERVREEVRRGEKAGTRSHLSLLSHCWRQSRQTLRDRRDGGGGGGGGYEALFREELASLSLKRNTIKSVYSPREDDSPCSADDAPPRPFYFSPTYPSLRLSLPGVTPPSRLYILSTLPLFVFQLSLHSRAYCFICAS